MKIAYMISAYTDAPNLGRLVRALGDQYFFIHIDKNVDQKPFEMELKACKNVIFVKERIAVNWGAGDRLNIKKSCFRKCAVQEYMIEWFA